MIKVEKCNKIIEYLEKNSMINLNILGIINNIPEAEIYVNDLENIKGVLVRNDYFNYVYTEDDEFIDNMLEELFKKGWFGFSGVNKPLAEKIKKRCKIDWQNSCDVYYMESKYIDLSKIKNKVERVQLKDREIINGYYTYKDEESLSKIDRYIRNNHSAAIYKDGNIASWAFRHDDNSMGIMYTKEEYRGSGFGYDVTMHLANMLIEDGITPYVHIEKGNTMSPGLAVKSGFKKCGEVEWFGIVVEGEEITSGV